MIEAFYFRGLSTSGHDHIHWGKFKLASYFQPMQDAMIRRGIRLTPVLGMGGGSLDEIADRAFDFIVKHNLYTSERACHLIGHSAGGLIARAVQARSGGHFTTVTTIATAHRGSRLAERSLEVGHAYPKTNRLLKALGYNLEEKRDSLAAMTPISVERFLMKVGETPRAASVICSCPPEQWPLPLRLMHRLAPLRDLDFVGDGVVERSSQSYGEVLGEVAVDHLAQIGFSRDRSGVEKICDLVEEFLKRSRNLT